MRRYLRISLFIFLLLALPLFVTNVKALEIDDETIANIKSLIPLEYNVDLREEDAFILEDDGNDKVSLEIINQINLIFNDNEIDIKTLGVSYRVDRVYYEEDTTINDYRIIFYDDISDIDTIDIVVNYNNSDDFNEEDLEYVEDITSDINEIVVDNYVDFYTEEVIENNSIDTVTDELFNDYEIDYYNETDVVIDDVLSTDEYGYTYVLKDGILYDYIPNNIKTTPIISITNDISDSEILSKVYEQYKLDIPENITSNDLEFRNDLVCIKNSNYCLGRLVIKKINDNERNNYNYLDGSNVTINRGELLSIRVAASKDKFIKVLIDNMEVNRSLYNLSEGSTIVSFNNSFLNSLSEGVHTLVVRFIDGDAVTGFTIKTNNYIPNISRVETTNYSSYNKTYYRYYDYDVDLIEGSNDNIRESVNTVLLETKKENNDLKEIKKIIKEEPVVKKKLSDKDAIKIDNKIFKNFVPIVIIIFACCFGLFGYFLYRKSLNY